MTPFSLVAAGTDIRDNPCCGHERSRQVRLIVVGSGIVGASCAFEAASLGADVVLVDAAIPGAATAAGAGIICPWDSLRDEPAWQSIAYPAAREYPELVSRLAELGEADVGYRQVGALALADDEDEQQRIRERLLARRAVAPEVGDVYDVSGTEAVRMFPPLRPDVRAVYIGGAARVDGRLMAAALVRAAAQQGAAVMEGEARLAWRSGGVAGVEVGGELVECDAVVAAAGAWTGSFLRPAGLTVRVEPQRGQIMHLTLGSVDTSRWPVVLPGGSGHYLLAFDDSRVVAGATRETGSGFDYRVTPAGLAEVLAQALAVAPGLASATYSETRVGFRPVGPDVLPLLGPVPGMQGLVIATGLGASGLTMGPYAGLIAARVALGLPSPVELGPFAPLRGA
jgi:D-amino-acid dehydrogenase